MKPSLTLANGMSSSLAFLPNYKQLTSKSNLFCSRTRLILLLTIFNGSQKSSGKKITFMACTALLICLSTFITNLFLLLYSSKVVLRIFTCFRGLVKHEDPEMEAVNVVTKLNQPKTE
jgi:hypothetical protein